MPRKCTNSVNRKTAKHFGDIRNGLKGNHKGFIDGLSHPRPGSHWKGLLRGQEVIALPSKYDAKVYFYNISDPITSWLPVDLFYNNFSFIRQALPDEDFMAPMKLNE